MDAAAFDRYAHGSGDDGDDCGDDGDRTVDHSGDGDDDGDDTAVGADDVRHSQSLQLQARSSSCHYQRQGSD